MGAALLITGVLVFFLLKRNEREDQPPSVPSGLEMERAGSVRVGGEVERSQPDGIIGSSVRQ